MSASAEEYLDNEKTTDIETPPTDAEVTQLIDSIKSASETEIDPALYYGSSVFDFTAMAPLSPASAVSTCLSQHHLLYSHFAVVVVYIEHNNADHLQGSSCAPTSV